MNDTRICTIEMNNTTTIRLTIYSMVLFIVSWALPGVLLGDGKGEHFEIGLTAIIFYATTYILALGLHELVHGLFFKIYGGKPEYGLGVSYIIPYAYATVKDYPLNVNQILVVGLSPAVLLSVVFLFLAYFVPITANFMVFAFAANLSGSIVDFWLSHQLLRFRKFEDIRVFDRIDRYDIYGSEGVGKELSLQYPDLIDGKHNEVKNRPKSTLVLNWIVATGLFMFLQAIVTAIGPLFVDKMAVGAAGFYLIEYDSSRESAHFYFNFLPAIICGLFAAIVIGLFRRNSNSGLDV
jgi:hypothetical protein